MLPCDLNLWIDLLLSNLLNLKPELKPRKRSPTGTINVSLEICFIPSGSIPSRLILGETTLGSITESALEYMDISEAYYLEQ